MRTAPRWSPRQKLVPVLVESPYGRMHGPDRVERVQDPIAAMRPAPSLLELAAAKKYREAFDAVGGPIRCALDISGGAGGGIPQGPGARQAEAANILKQAAMILGERDGHIMRLMAGEGRSLREATAVFYDKPSARDQVAVGRRLREGLVTLAARWFPVSHPLRAHRSGPRSSVIESEVRREDVQGRVAHATGSRVFGYEPEGGQPDEPELRKRARDRRRA